MQTKFDLRLRRRRLLSVLATVAVLLDLSPLLGAGVSWRQALSQRPDWYASQEAVRIADNVLRFQRFSGGWPKNIDMATALSAADRQRLERERERNDAGIDNGATTTQLRYLARVAQATQETRFREAFLRGLDYLLAGQYPNGGWPQFFPKPRGYSAHITFNDNAMVDVLSLLQDIMRERPEFAFVDSAHRRRAGEAISRGVTCILRCQIVVDGHRTAWCAQHDEQTLAPAPARSYEKVSLSGSESVGVVRFLMSLEDPSPEVREAVTAAVEWFQAVKLTGIRQTRKTDPDLPRGYDKVIIPDPDAPPLWARFYEIGTNRPIFCGRDGVIKYSLVEIEHERRVGYSWYTDGPARLLEVDYPRWRAKIGATRGEGTVSQTP